MPETKTDEWPVGCQKPTRCAEKDPCVMSILPTRPSGPQPIRLSPFWRTPNFEHNEPVMVRRLGPSHDGCEYRGIIKGYYACDVDGNPDCYIVEMLDPLPGSTMSCHVFPRGCVDSVRDVETPKTALSGTRGSRLPA